MNKNSIFCFLINPFERIAGVKALVIGIVFCVLIGLLGCFSGAYFDGVLDCHLSERGNLLQSAVFLCIDWASLVIVFGILAVIFAKNVRFIDIMGTFALSQAPRLFEALSAFFVPSAFLNKIETLQNPLELLDELLRQPAFIIFSIISIVATIWYITLIYNAFRISTNIKTPKIIFIFIAGILLAEVLSKASISMI
jgi:hypothetical protein